jgi:cytochrome c oxidase cbb3-type subunit 3
METTMSQSTEENLTGHNYDGIQEYDNPTPGWWVLLFWLTVIFAGLYAPFMILGGEFMAPSGFYERDSIEMMKLQYGQLGNVKPDAVTLLRLGADPKWNKVGASIFASNCTSCHGIDGSGMAGPNLTDDYYIHVRKIEDIHDVITNGRKNGAMPAWGNRLMPVERVLVASYVASLRGKNLPSVGGRPAEGQLIPPWTAGEAEKK